MTHKRLSIHVSTLKKMIEGNYLYVDKTKYIYNLFQGISHYYFLSRPRRFGKSLLISTLYEMFSGNKELFKNLWIGSSDYDWQKYPIIHLDFSNVAHGTTEELKKSLIWTLHSISASYQVDILDAPTLSDKFVDLIRKLGQINKVVILIDEYDKPVLDHIKNVEQADAQRDVLKSFYDAIKGVDNHIRTVFVTGVSRFSKTSLFSGMNNLDDLTLDPQAAQLLGYTEQEIETYFLPYLQDFSQDKKIPISEIRNKLKTWYNGYRFSKESTLVYNPFSLLYSLHKKQLENYWYQSGTPTFLTHLVKNQYRQMEEIDQGEFSFDTLGNFELAHIPLIPLLFQTGYLTINDYDEKTNKFKLNFPNYEVELSFTKFLVGVLTDSPSTLMDSLGSQLIQSLHANDIERFCSILQTLLAHIPYTLIHREDYYHTLIQFLFSLLSLESQSEIMTNKGRIDLVLSTSTHTYIFEFKLNTKPEVALDQIKKRGYYERFLYGKHSVVLVGLSLIREEGTLRLHYATETKVLQ